MLSDHVFTNVERVISSTDGYVVVEKTAAVAEITDATDPNAYWAVWTRTPARLERHADRGCSGDLIVASRTRQESGEEQFVTNAAHELQSPLTAIVSAVEVLQAGAKDTPERDIFLDHIEQAAARLVRLTRALLVLSRVQTRTEAPKTELVALEPLLSDIAARVSTQDGVDLAVSCPADAAVVTNRDLVDHAVLNVLTNATNYTTKGRIELSARLDEGAAEISVSDTGAGISEVEQKRVFERFYRGEAGTDNGSGLGLAIAHAAIEAVGGSVELESELGTGTTVRFRFPQGASLVAE